MMDSPLHSRDGLLPETSHVPALLGETLGGVPFALFDGDVTHQIEYLGGPGRGGNIVDVLFKTAARGVHVRDPDEIVISEATVRLHGLLELLTGGQIDTPLLTVSPERGSSDHVVIELPESRLSLVAGPTEKRSRRETSQTLDAFAHFSLPVGVALSELDRLIEPLRDMVTFSTREPSSEIDLSGWPPRTVEPPVVDIEQVLAEIKICRTSPFEHPPRRASSFYALLLNPATVPDPAALVVAWYDLRERLGPVWSLLFGTLLRPNLPLENRLLNLAAFAEGYHRTLHDEPPLTKTEAAAARRSILSQLEDERVREVFERVLPHANSQSQRDRLGWLTERALETVDWTLDAAQLCRELADTRNWLTHWGRRGKHVQEGADLRRLLQRLDAVISVNLMLDLGVGPGGVAQVATGFMAGLP
jgi:hypothetical protein